MSWQAGRAHSRLAFFSLLILWVNALLTQEEGKKKKNEQWNCNWQVLRVGLLNWWPGDSHQRLLSSLARPPSHLLPSPLSSPSRYF